MNEVKCPNCHTVFEVDESVYMDIVKQVRDREFEKEKEQLEQSFQTQKENELERVREQHRHREQELETKLANEKQSYEQKATILQQQIEQQFRQSIVEKDKEIEQLKQQAKTKEAENRLMLQQQTDALEKQVLDVQHELQIKQKEFESSQAGLKENYETALRLKDEQIEQIKDFKARQSTKMLGESLEKHCENQFNQLRATAFPNAYFGKDNDAALGSKGDYIYRETDENGIEILSIMFEMKNQQEETTSKKKNEDFFKKLDKDRKDKQCEYAVLVSLLEPDSELYNNGIVDVSYQYPKMYVIRPQFFIPMITILRNAAMNALSYRQQLDLIRNQNID
ncbi:MAG: DUF2130 domain-containing protein, partial [Erysipelotrichaceae bacterium]|nr:DUF2130 domain-containing protein [Erysipelotrichaceae bacterium]